MLINLSNHPHALWPENQYSAALRYGTLVDIHFPEINPEGDEDYIDALSDEYLQKILNIASDKDVTIHLMGEMTFSFALIRKLKEQHIECIASTTKRIIHETDGHTKQVSFQFERFRKYS